MQLFELNTIDFSHNEITSIGRSVFTSLFSLRHLTFRHNNLTDLDTSTFGKLPSLLDLDLSYNQLKKVDESFQWTSVLYLLVIIAHYSVNAKCLYSVSESMVLIARCVAACLAA